MTYLHLKWTQILYIIKWQFLQPMNWMKLERSLQCTGVNDHFSPNPTPLKDCLNMVLAHLLHKLTKYSSVVSAVSPLMYRLVLLSFSSSGSLLTSSLPPDPRLPIAGGGLLGILYACWKYIHVNKNTFISLKIVVHNKITILSNQKETNVGYWVGITKEKD